MIYVVLKSLMLVLSVVLVILALKIHQQVREQRRNLERQAKLFTPKGGR